MNIFTAVLFQPLANLLVIFYRILGNNMGLAIIGLTLTLVLVLRPLTKKSMESMKKMKDYGPQLEKLKNKYKNDKQKLMQAQAQFYKEKGINPGAGCLPMLLQFVILIALIQVFLKALTGSDPKNLNELLYMPFQFKAHELINTSFLYLNVTKPDVFRIPGVNFDFPGLVVLLAALSQMISAKIAAPFIEASEKAAKKTAGAADDFATAMQASSVYTFPLMTLLIGGRFPAGVALYWFIFSCYQAYMQYRSTGLGGLKSWINKLRVIKSPHEQK